MPPHKETCFAFVCLKVGQAVLSHGRPCLVLIVSPLIASFDLVSAQDAHLTVAGITNFARVNDRLYRGAQPNADGIKSLARLGVRTIINLRMTNDVWSAEEAKARDVGITYTNVPMSGISPDA
ncbi:MAG: hypothetical protein DME23_13550 [Verrucomicrobia bacterium]|nr:MAG: hypothetical protein DME23_13550 [Verrucomicrobiota bacterium]